MSGPGSENSKLTGKQETHRFLLSCFCILKMKFFLITNNPLTKSVLEGRHELLFVDGTLLDVLFKARDYCHKGHILLTHPLSGSVKPNETLYKTIMISKKQDSTDFDSVMLIEKAIETVRKFGSVRRQWQEREKEDFQMIDMILIQSAIESCNENYDNA